MGILHIIWMIIVGFVVGALARWIYPGAITMGFWATALVGIIGSLVGGVIGGVCGARRTAIPSGRVDPLGGRRAARTLALSHLRRE